MIWKAYECRCTAASCLQSYFPTRGARENQTKGSTECLMAMDVRNGEREKDVSDESHLCGRHIPPTPSAERQGRALPYYHSAAWLPGHPTLNLSIVNIMF